MKPHLFLRLCCAVALVALALMVFGQTGLATLTSTVFVARFQF